ncbi:hypothetical protein [Ruegeria atlantica]|uniref:Uncharacterized protein n=1 Tax=Ruegeria atlantica TaxID=81569 RepID=A0A0P1EH48_9RHOB|nr:hypothetical protein [Ruegeria atlantica]CUH49658.1 hypothetical protein RUA4292_03855 [Ruegeria atlantica]
MLLVTFKAVEKTFVFGATIAALIPLAQWTRESEARNFERMASFIELGDTCSNWMQDEVIEGMAIELKDTIERDEELAPIPVQVRANQIIFCADVLDWFQDEFGREGDPSAYEYLEMVFYASHWAVPNNYEDYLVKVRNNPNLAGTHEAYSTASPWWQAETVDEYLESGRN